MKTNTKNNIYNYICNYSPVSVDNIFDKINISKSMIHRHLRKLIKEGFIYKIWTSPKVYYFQNKNNIIKNFNWIDYKSDNVLEKDENNIEIIDNDKYKFLKDNYVYFAPDWNVNYWISWFIKWCNKRDFKHDKEIETYKNIIIKYNKFKTKYWLIKWIEKMKNTFDKVYLNKVYYLDFYSIEKYWKTYLWNLMFYSKQTWDKELADKILDSIKPLIYKLINKKNIDSFAFIPPSIDRKIQLMDELKDWLDINLNELKLIKIFKDKVVAQKSLNKKEDRIQNARDTIFILDKDFKSDTILLIDDAIWSWATLNETAKKIKEKNIAKKVIWLSIVWSYKWFEVINEV